MCGEKMDKWRATISSMGSPPRVRGEGRDILLAVVQGRITPACAGRSIRYCAARHPRKDHPRVCGEKDEEYQLRVLEEGSPPRVRGEVVSCCRA